MSFETVTAKKIFCQNVFIALNFLIEVTSIVTEFIVVLSLYYFVDIIQSMNGNVC